MGRGGVAGALFVTLAVMVPLPTSAAEKASSEADNQLEMKAREQFAAGRFDEAIDTFAKMYAKSLNPIYLRNIGRCYQKKREPQKAIDEFQDYLAKTKSGKNRISADERAEIDGYIKDMEALRDEQARAAAAPPPPVTPLVTTPVATTSLPSAPPPVENGAAATLVAAPAPASHPFYARWWFWTIVGVVAVGTAVTVVALSGGTTKPACTAPGGCQ